MDKESKSAELAALDFDVQAAGEKADLCPRDAEAVRDRPGGGAGEAPVGIEGGTDGFFEIRRQV